MENLYQQFKICDITLTNEDKLCILLLKCEVTNQLINVQLNRSAFNLIQIPQTVLDLTQTKLGVFESFVFKNSLKKLAKLKNVHDILIETINESHLTSVDELLDATKYDPVCNMLSRIGDYSKKLADKLDKLNNCFSEDMASAAECILFEDYFISLLKGSSLVLEGQTIVKIF